MDSEMRHDEVLNLPLCFAGDDARAEAFDAAAPQSAPQQLQTRPYSATSRIRQDENAAENGLRRAPPTPGSPSFTVYIRVPGPRNGFQDPPDVDWNCEKDEALWRILSRGSKNDIDWEELAHTFDATVDFLVIQANVLTERHVSQVRAQTRKVAALGTRDSPVNSPILPGTAAFRTTTRTSTPTSEGMGRTLSGRGIPKTMSAEALRRTASARHISEMPPVRPHVGSRKTSAVREADYTEGRQSPANGRRSAGRDRSPVEHTFTIPEDSRPVRPRSRFSSYTVETTRYPRTTARENAPEEDDGDLDPLSSMASSSSSDSPSSEPSQPVMSRIFKRPPGYQPQQDDFDAEASTDTTRAAARGNSGRFGGGVGLGVGTSYRGGTAGSDDGEESETQPAFLPFKSPTLAATTMGSRSHGRTSTKRSGPNRLATASPSSSSASASPTAKMTQYGGASTRSIGDPVTTPTSPAAAARLHPSRLPVLRSSPSASHRGISTGRASGAARYSREDSETGTTPSMGSSFSDLDELTQSVLDEALASKVEDSSARSESSTNLEGSTSTTGRRPR